MTEGSRTVEELLERARGGDLDAFGELLAQYRNYARLLARTLIGTTLRLRLDPSDLVQETFLEAHRDFPRFEGASEREVVAWLRRILVRNLADQARRQKAGLRDYRRQESLEAALERSGRGCRRPWRRRRRPRARRRRGGSRRCCWPTPWPRCRPTIAR